MVEKREKSQAEIIGLLVENFVSLQAALTNLTIKLDKLANEISQLLKLFEISARDFVRKTPQIAGSDRELLDRINMLLEQNKEISQRLNSVEQGLKKGEEETVNTNIKPKPLPKV